MGPGLGKAPETKEFVKRIIAGTTCPIILDADALNLLAGERDYVAPFGNRIIMTPHLAEFSRLSGQRIGAITEDIIGVAKAFVSQWHVNLVVKGVPTVIVSAKTGNAYVNPTGNAGMACGGMGDILTGMMAACAAHQGMPDLCSAACAAVYLHGAAGDQCRQDRGSYGFTPMETADAVPAVITRLEADMAVPVLQRPMIK
jgi:NAD(P)H-hydrate epimerase